MKLPAIPPVVWRVLRIAGIAAAAAAVVIAGVATWLVATEPGLRVLVSTGVSRSPIEIKVEHVGGRVLGPLRLRGIEVSQGGNRMRLDECVLDWQPNALWSRRLHVRSLVLDGLEISLAAPDPNAKKPETKPLELPDLELPMTVVVDTFRLREITLRQAGRANALTISEIALDGLQYRDSLGVQRFALATPWGELGFHGWVRTRGEYPLDLTLQWTLAPPDFPRVTGAGTVTGNFDLLTVRQTVTSPASLFTTVTLESLTTAPRFDLSARLDPLALRTLRKDAPAATVGGTIDAKGDLKRQNARLDLSYASRETGRWDLRATANAAMPNVDVSSFALAQRGSRARVEGSGSARIDSTRTSFAARAAWAHLALPPVGTPQVTLARGRLQGEGGLARYTVSLETSVGGARGREESLRASGHGDTTSFVLESLAGSLLGGAIDASGHIKWSPAIAWDAKAVTRDLDVGILAPGWPSKLGGRIETKGSLRGKNWTANLDLTELAGTLRGHPLDGRLHFAGARGGKSALDTELHYAGAAFTAVGPAFEPIDLAWTLDVPALAELDTSLVGTLRGSGRIAGTDSVATATAEITGTDLAYAGARVAALVVTAHFDRTRDDALELALTTGRIDAPQIAPFDSVRVTASGTRDGYAFAVAVESALRRLSASGTAAPHDSAWAGRLERLDLAVAKNTPWALETPAPFDVGPSAGSLGPLALRAGPARLDAEAQWRMPGEAHVRAALDGLPLENLNAFLPDSVRIDGSLSMTSDATLHPNGVLDAKLALRPLAGSVRVGGKQPLDVAFADVTFELASGAEELAARGGAVLPALGNASTEIHLPGFRWNRVDSTQAISGTLRAEVGTWTLVEQFFDEVRKVAGKFTADVRFAGTLAAPRLGGDVKFENGAFDAPIAGLEVRDLELEAHAAENGKWNLASSLRSGKGTLAAKADADLSDASHPRATIGLSGKDFLLIDIPEARVVVAPELKIRVDGDRVDVGGELTVPSAKIDAGNKMIALAVPPSPDVIVPRERADSTAIPFDLYTDVRLTLGDDVSFKGHGLEAEPTGSVRVTQKPNKPALGQGEFELETGKYSGYGRDLKIERGRLVYAGGPVDDPELDLRASREIKDEDVTVGFEVKGTLKKSQLEVFSDPDMSQSDAISYLLFGRPVSEAKNSESAIARETATAIGLQAGSAYTQKLGSKFGLDEASIESESTIQEASLMLGTYLTPSLYARYGVGLFDSANTFQLSYLLNRHWTLKAETSDENRAGILYTIEPGRRSSK